MNMLEDNLRYQALHDAVDFYELVDALHELGIIDKETLLHDYWEKIEEHVEEIVGGTRLGG